jgi:3-hydroxyacyl-CoA dehydrogenase
LLLLVDAVSAATSSGKSRRLAAIELSDVFGIDLDTDNLERSSQPPSRKPPRKTMPKPAKRGRVKKAAAGKKAARGSRSTAGRKTKKNTTHKTPGRRRACVGKVS